MNQALNRQARRPKEFKGFGLEKQIDEINGAGAYHVDSRTFEKDWKKGWICYIDLLAFSAVCKRSNDSTINLIQRFQRVIGMAKERVKGRLYVFTDSCFFVSDDLFSAINFAVCTMNGCCAMNQIVFLEKKLVMAHFLLRPRITIAYGDYINAFRISNNYLKNDINNHLLAGNGIVYAYETEKESFSHDIAINLTQSEKKVKDLFSVGGNQSLSKIGMTRWIEESNDSSLVHFPWPFVKKTSVADNQITLFPNTNDEFLKTEKNLFETAQYMKMDFFNEDMPIVVSKHIMALTKSVYNFYRLSKRANNVTLNLKKELEALL